MVLKNSCMHEICSAGLSNTIKVLYQRRGVPDSVIEAIIRDGKVSLDLRFKPSQILNALDRPIPAIEAPLQLSQLCGRQQTMKASLTHRQTVKSGYFR